MQPQNNQVQKAQATPAQLVRDLVEQQKKQIAMALPKHLSPDRMLRIAFTELSKNPELADCDRNSFLGAIIQCAQLGLEPGSGLGHAYLVPFNNRKKGIKEVQFIPGYRGLIDLARRSGQIETISARVVREKDVFRYQYGDDERIEHMPFEGPVEEAGKITYVYAVARLKGGGVQREVMTRRQIDAIAGNTTVWKDYFDEMARKTVVRRICKYLPMSPEMASAIEKDDANHNGETQANWSVIDAGYEPIAPAHDPEKTKSILSARDVTPQAEAFANHEVACKTFDLEWKHLVEMGHDPQTILKKSPPEIRGGSTESIFLAADILKEWGDAKMGKTT